jgi:SAM-dependent methyltransferase
MAETDRGHRTSPRRVSLPASDRRAWESTYVETDYRELPWYSPRPSPWLVHAVEERWIAPGSNVLDVGCGAGSNVLWLGRHGFRASGVDIAPGAIAAAEARARAARVAVSFRVADVVDLPFPRAAFGAALDSGCFHSLPIRLRPAYATEISRVLRPGSPFLLTWVGREETRWQGPPHRPSLAEVASVFEPRFIFGVTQFHGPGSRHGWAHPGRSLARYTAYLIRRQGRQPAPR